jgi:hypothetical protein
MRIKVKLFEYCRYVTLNGNRVAALVLVYSPEQTVRRLELLGSPDHLNERRFLRPFEQSMR